MLLLSPPPRRRSSSPLGTDRDNVGRMNGSANYDYNNGGYYSSYKEEDKEKDEDKKLRGGRIRGNGYGIVENARNDDAYDAGKKTRARTDAWMETGKETGTEPYDDDGQYLRHRPLILAVEAAGTAAAAAPSRRRNGDNDRGANPARRRRDMTSREGDGEIRVVVNDNDNDCDGYEDGEGVSGDGNRTVLQRRPGRGRQLEGLGGGIYP